MREDGLAAGHDRTIRGRERVPLLPFTTQREVGREEVRLVEIETDAAVERRPAHMRARRPRAAEEIQVVIFGIDARFQGLEVELQ